MANTRTWPNEIIHVSGSWLAEECIGAALADEHFISDAVDVHEAHGGVVGEVLAQLGDEHVHRAGVEVGVVAPNLLEGEVAPHDVV